MDGKNNAAPSLPGAGLGKEEQARTYSIMTANPSALQFTETTLRRVDRRTHRLATESDRERVRGVARLATRARSRRWQGGTFTEPSGAVVRGPD